MTSECAKVLKIPRTRGESGTESGSAPLPRVQLYTRTIVASLLEQAVMDCAGRAQRRRRFGPGGDLVLPTAVPTQSGVASDLPPQSKWRAWCVCRAAPLSIHLTPGN